MANTVLQTKNINKYFYDPVKFKVLSDINMSINEGEFVSIVGKSGCGKSTLLYILSTMDTDYEGELLINGDDLSKKTDSNFDAEADAFLSTCKKRKGVSHA